MPLTFITGPVSSYVATARADPEDPEWAQRLARHAARRPPSWSLVETASPHGRDLAALILAANEAGVVLVDSLGTWLADRMNVHLPRIDALALEEEAHALADALTVSGAHLIAVSEEVGWGIVPVHPSGRLFRDVLGALNKRLALAAQRAYLIVSGMPLPLNDLTARRRDPECAGNMVEEESGGAGTSLVSL
jgi:adenosylcobinamide kinase/adenosylcobinamide-phosphate guanylyltransferase